MYPAMPPSGDGAATENLPASDTFAPEVNHGAMVMILSGDGGFAYAEPCFIVVRIELVNPSLMTNLPEYYPLRLFLICEWNL